MNYRYSEKTVVVTKIIEWCFFIITILFLKPLSLFRKPNIKPSILLIEPFQMGDVLSLSPMFDIIKESKNETSIFILTKHGNKNIYQNDPRVSGTFTFDCPWSDSGEKPISFNNIFRYIGVFTSIWKLRKQNFDFGIDVRGDIRSQFISNWVGCYKTVGHIKYLGSNVVLRGLLIDKKVELEQVHRYEWNLATLVPLGFNDINVTLPSFYIDNIERIFDFRYIVIHCGAGWEYRRWSLGKWEQLINHITNTYKDLKVVIIGGKEEEEQIVFLTKKLLNLECIISKQTNFEELVSLLYFSSLFIGLDSGPMNLACTLNKNVLVLFGPGNSTMWYPYKRKNGIIHKKENFPCNPCIQKGCYYAGKNCMDAIELKEVINKVDQFLHNKS